MRLVENGTVSMVVVVHVDDIFSVGRKKRCDQFGEISTSTSLSLTLES